MKKIKLIIILNLLTVSIFSQTIKSVSNVRELLEAIKPNTKIQLTADLYVISDEDSTYGEYFELDENNLLIKNVSNLTIVGFKTKPAKIITHNLTKTVITFSNCRNINIRNLEVGHTPLSLSYGDRCEEYANVIDIEDSDEINISECILFGSGDGGIETRGNTGVSQLRCENTIIRHCTTYIVNLSNTSDAAFKNCRFESNTGRINLSDCINISFENCEVNDNILQEEYSDNTLIYIQKSNGISLTNCNFESNVSDYFCNASNIGVFDKCKFKNNYFKKGRFNE